MAMRVVAYMRVATAAQDTEMIFKQQYESIKKYCEERGYKIIRRERFIGGGKDANRNLRKLMRKVKRSKGNLIVATRWDRFTRDIPFFFKMQKKMAKRNISMETSAELCNVMSVSQLARCFI